MLDPRAVLRRYGIRPSKGLGQNFLIQGSIMERTVEASDISSDDVVLEVGPGVGVLTRLLAERARHVVAVELDDRLIPVLESELGSCENVTIVHNDILAINPAEIVPMDEGLHYKVVANLPYYITSAVLRHLLEAELVPEQLTVMVQREVAQRIVAVPGNMSLLALSVQVYGKPRLALHVPAASFYPAPKVDSAVLVITSHPQPLVSVDERERFFKVARAGFGQKRKQLHNALASNLPCDDQIARQALQAAGLPAAIRAQKLDIAEWLALATELHTLGCC